jgi:hypothetical protein
MCDIFIVELEFVSELVCDNRMSKSVIKKNSKKLVRPLSIMVDDEYKNKYDTLSTEKKVRVAEHLRLVIYPELDRLWNLENLDNVG